jgi:hypothetical protein
MAQSTDHDATIIRVLIEFKTTGVTVSMPNWNSGDVGFGFGWEQ